jgi:hypothetical protein
MFEKKEDEKTELERLLKEEFDFKERAKVEAYLPDRQRFINEAHKRTVRIEEIRKKLDGKRAEEEEQQKQETIKHNRSKYRYCDDTTQIEGYIAGQYTLDVLNFKEFPTDEVEIQTRYGKTKLFSLVKDLSSADVHRLMEKRLTPLIINVAPTGFYTSSGKRAGLWLPEDIESSRKLNPQLRSLMAIMYV